MFRQKSALLVFISIAVLATVSDIFAVSTARIDVVRSKEILSNDDTDKIEDFISAALTEFMSIDDFSRASEIRTVIVTRSSSELESGQIQYGPRFMTAAQREIEKAASHISELAPSHRRTMLEMNMAMIIEGLGNVEIAKSALRYLENDKVMVRYWAVKALTNCIADEQDYSTKLVGQFAEKIKAVSAGETSADVLVQMARFAAAVKSATGTDIIVTVADKRIAEYNSWDVSNEMAEAEILTAMVNRIKKDISNSAAVAKSFALLYSAVIQRYALGEEVLSDTSKVYLTSVITQTEKHLPRMVVDWQSTFKRAIEKNSMSTLLAEHDVLFGTSSKAGKLPAAMAFDYGKAPDGSAKNAPPAISRPPKGL